MKNVTRLPKFAPYTIAIPGSLIFDSWAIRYLSGIDDGEVKPGHWLAKWDHTPMTIEFGFSQKENLLFLNEAAAQSVAETLRREREIETEVIQVGVEIAASDG